MRASTAFFAGAGTVIAAILVGLGGGLTVANIMNPHPQKRSTLIERRMSAEARATTTQQAPVPYLEARLPGTQADVASQPAPRAQASTANEAKQAGADTAKPPEDANAKARDADLKRLSDKRKVDRRQQWLDRQQRYRDRRDAEWRDVSRPRDDDQADRAYVERRGDFDRPMPTGFPRFNPFGPD